MASKRAERIAIGIPLALLLVGGVSSLFTHQSTPQEIHEARAREIMSKGFDREWAESVIRAEDRPDSAYVKEQRRQHQAEIDRAVQR